MAASASTHSEREQAVLTDLETSFPQFAGSTLSWSKVLDGQDPPDFVGRGPTGSIGLELVEWLDGGQMGPAKGRESQRGCIRSVLGTNWNREYQPQHFNLAVVVPKWGLRVAPSDEDGLRGQFFACAAAVDQGWLTNPERHGRAYYRTEFADFPLMEKYFGAVRYIGGHPHGSCWIDVEEDGGAYDPNVVIRTLEQALEKKLVDYSAPGKQAHLKRQALGEFCLLVHGGFNAYCYNTPKGPLSLDEVGQAAAAFYAAHPQRHVFDRVWFFDSLDSADELNQLIGYPPNYGRVRWLAQLWPEFKVHQGSLGS